MLVPIAIVRSWLVPHGSHAIYTKRPSVTLETQDGPPVAEDEVGVLPYVKVKPLDSVSNLYALKYLL